MFNIALTVLLQSVIFVVLIGVFFKILEKKVAATIDGLLEGVFGQPLVKGAMSVLGKKSGEVRASSAAVDDMAGKFLSGPNMAGIKMIASQVGFDLDEYMEEHGAVNTIAAFSQLAGMIGIDVKQLLAGDGLKGVLSKGLIGSGTSGNTKNPYL